MTQTMDALEPTAAEQAYLAQQLNNVSRSFALVIPVVETPARYYLAIAYLLCRVVDNIEDCGQPAAWKEQRFAEFVQLLDDPSDAAAILGRWEGLDWPALTDLERRLMGLQDGLILWQLYTQMPSAARGTVQRWIGAMAQGMRQLSDPTVCPCFVKHGAVELLEEEADFDLYCYYVAGTVGNLASELVVMQYRLGADLAETLQARAPACGRSLQKTNILKDFVEDLGRGICYLPDTWLRKAAYAPLELQGAAPAWKAMVLEDVLGELRGATDYLLALPLSASGYRRASLLCLLPSYQTLLLAAQRLGALFTSRHQIRLSHPTMALCIADSLKMLHDNDAIRQYSRRLETEIRGHFSRSGARSER